MIKGYLYAKEIMERFGIQNNNNVTNHLVPISKLSKDDNRVLVNGTILMYLNATILDLMFVVCLVNKIYGKINRDAPNCCKDDP